MSSFTLVKSWLQQRQIRVPDDWLEACLEWLQEENQGAALSGDRLTGMVYEQFLAADLRELQTPCVPPAVALESKFMLQGVFCLQVDSVIDVSQPYYGQLQKVQGTENANVHVTATQPTQPGPEIKAGRVLMLKLTDGVTDVQGMEYRPIPSLKTSLLPGCKVRIKGRLLCRKGVLFLKSDNVEILGGEVDSLVEVNTQDRLLQNALASVGQASTEGHRKEFSNTQISRNTTSGSAVERQGQITLGVQEMNRGVQNNPVQLRASSNTSQNNLTQSRAAFITAQNHRTQSRAPLNTAQINPVQSRISSKTAQNRPTDGRKQTLFPEDEMDDDDDFLESLGTTELAALDEEWDVEMEDVSTGQTGKPSSSSTSHVNQLDKIPQKRSTSVVIGQSKPLASVSGMRQPMAAQNYQTRPAQLGQSRQGNPTNQNTSCINHGEGVSSSHRSGVKSAQTTHSEFEIELENLAELMDDDFPMDEVFDDSLVSYPPSAKRSKPPEVKNTVMTGKGPGASGVSRSVTRAAGGDSGTTSNVMLIPATSVNRSTKLPLPDFSKLKKPDDLLNHLKSAANNPRYNITGVNDDDPFTYLSKVEPNLHLKKAFCCKVKAYVATLLSRLESGQGLGWNLTCRLNDGTGTLDVDLTDQVLTRLIGFTAKESIVKKGTGEKSALSEGIKNCQLKLINISCIFKVDYRPLNPRPQVTEIIPISYDHLEKLYTRVCYQMSGR